MNMKGVEATAILSENRRYRYTLTRVWNEKGPRVCWIMLNPRGARKREVHRDGSGADLRGHRGLGRGNPEDPGRNEALHPAAVRVGLYEVELLRCEQVRDAEASALPARRRALARMERLQRHE